VTRADQRRFCALQRSITCVFSSVCRRRYS
jgi:hypothetical protein